MGRTCHSARCDGEKILRGLKRQLAAEFPHDCAAYTDAKVPFFWEAIRRADEWARRTGWEPGPSDA